MIFGVFLSGCRPRGGSRRAGAPVTSGDGRLITSRHVHVDRPSSTPQFWLLWAVLFLNVTAGHRDAGQASPMIQEMFEGAVKAKRRGAASWDC